MARVVAVVILLAWSLYRWMGYATSDDLLHLVFCDVGQGDAIIIRYNTTQVLVDGGRDNSVLQCLNRYVPPWDRQLEIVVATHPDADHIVGLVSVLENYQVGTLLHNGQGKETADFDRFRSAVKNQASQGSKVVVATQGQQVKIGDSIVLSVLFPHSSQARGGVSRTKTTEAVLSDVDEGFVITKDDANNHSVVLKLQYKELDVMLMGDLEAKGEAALIADEVITDVDVLKVGHHGAKTSTTQGFLDLSRPEVSVVSAGKNNSYGHPHPLVLERLSQSGSLILRTDQHSHIELVSDGYSLQRRK